MLPNERDCSRTLQRLYGTVWPALCWDRLCDCNGCASCACFRVTVAEKRLEAEKRKHDNKLQESAKTVDMYRSLYQSLGTVNPSPNRTVAHCNPNPIPHCRRPKDPKKIGSAKRSHR